MDDLHPAYQIGCLKENAASPQVRTRARTHSPRSRIYTGMTPTRDYYLVHAGVRSVFSPVFSLIDDSVHTQQ